MLEYFAGAVTALFAVTWGAILHMKWLDRKLLPPPTKPGPALRIVGKDEQA